MFFPASYSDEGLKYRTPVDIIYKGVNCSRLLTTPGKSELSVISKHVSG
jgi:hypothetical protein